MAFHSKIDLMEERILSFEPVAGTRTHVLLDSWYCAKVLWKAARARDFLITTGLKSNRWLRVEDPTEEQGWGWQRASDYTAQLQESDYQRLKWPGGTQEVYVHVVSTRVRKLYQCQVVIVRQSLSAPQSQTRYWASSDLRADLPTLFTHIAARWKIEVLFGDGKEELGLDHYQLMSAFAIVGFGRWLCWPMSFWRKSERACSSSGNAPALLARHAARFNAAIGGASWSGFMSSSNLESNPTPCMTGSPLEAAQSKSAKIECQRRRIRNKNLNIQRGTHLT